MASDGDKNKRMTDQPKIQRSSIVTSALAGTIKYE
jgi:hypothetical protein